MKSISKKMPRKRRDPMPSPPKKRRRRLTILEREEIINKCASGSSIGRIAQDLDISSEAVFQVLKTCGGLISPEKEDESQQSKKKSDLSVVEKAVLRWYEQQCCLGESISTQKFRNKAIELNHKINNDELFKASNSWVEGFKLRNNIQNVSIDSNDAEKSGKNYCKHFERMIKVEDIDPDDIYNVDEMLLSWRTLPSGQVKQKKQDFERIAVIVCCNSSGSHKIPLLIVGKEQLELKHDLDFNYISQPEGLVDENIFVHWFQNIFLKTVKNSKKYLFLDNAPPHFASVLDKDKEICEVRRLGVEINPLVQPINEIMNKVKFEYRKKLIQKYKVSSTMTVDFFLENWKLPDACHLLAAAWDRLESTDIEEAWSKLLNYQGIKSDIKIPPSFIAQVRKLPGLSWFSVKQIKEWFAQDQGHAWKQLSDEEIIQKAKESHSNGSRYRPNNGEEKATSDNYKNVSTPEVSLIKEEVLELVDENFGYSEENDVPSRNDLHKALETIQRWCKSRNKDDECLHLINQIKHFIEEDNSELMSEED